MNDQKIIEKGDYSLKQVYETLDRIFLQKGIEKKETVRGDYRVFRSWEIVRFCKFWENNVRIKGSGMVH